MRRDSVAHWIITRDHIKTGCGGNRSLAVKTKEDVAACTIPFRLYDDDNILYYSGKIAPGSLDAEGELAFEPLDWAMAHAGATRMDYRNPKTGKWKTL